MSATNNIPVDALATPPDDGEVLIWPRRDVLMSLVESNRRLRRAYRLRLLGRSADEWLRDGLQDDPVVLAGHQPVLIHPGVWVKSAALAGLAARLGAKARFVVVDSDAVGRLALLWPELIGQYYRVAEAPLLAGLGRTAANSFEQARAASADQWRAVFNHVPPKWRNDPTLALPTFLSAFLGSGTTSHAYVDRWIDGICAVDAAIGIASPDFVRVSDRFTPRPDQDHSLAAAFLAHLLLNADEFAAAYDKALADYRSRRRIRGRRHQISDLAVNAARTESPFWALNATGPRQRLFVSRKGNSDLRLWAGQQLLCTLDAKKLGDDSTAALSSALGDWRIRPRALTLTMYARLFAGDLFIHGVGGAKYDQVTDEIIRRFFRVEPPAYACVSATIRLPLARFDETIVNRTACLGRLRDLLFNPQRYAPGNDAAVASLLIERQLAVQESVQLRLNQPYRHHDRRRAFERIRQVNGAILAASPGVSEGIRQELVLIEARLAHDRIALNREWFLGLYTLDRLRQLAESVRLG